MKIFYSYCHKNVLKTFVLFWAPTVQKKKLSIKESFGKCDQICRFLQFPVDLVTSTKEILNGEVLFWQQKFPFFILSNNSVEKNINIQQAVFYSFLKRLGLKHKKIINISYLIIVVIKMRLLISCAFSRDVLGCKYGIFFQILLYNLMQNCIFLCLV